jgi:hypothetical protein
MCKIEKKEGFNHIGYYKEGTNILNREDGPAIELADGTSQWFFNGKRHRLNGPAIDYSGERFEWWVDGYLHREDGPAKIWPGVGVEWWLQGKSFPTKEAWFEALPEDKRLEMLYSESFIGDCHV